MFTQNRAEFAAAVEASVKAAYKELDAQQKAQLQ
jgi:hypothetical protein